MIRFLFFSLKRAWQGFWRNALMSLAATATMVLMLLLLSGVWVVQTGLNAGLAYIEQKVEVVAELTPTATSQQVSQLTAQLQAIPEVSSVTYVSAAEALDQLRQSLKEQGRPDLTAYLDSNPLPATLEIKLKDPNRFGNVVTFLDAQHDTVASVRQIQKLVNQVLTVTNVLRTVGIGMIIVVGFVVLFIIINTIRLAVVARSEEIEIMRLVGASDAFIRWPFIFEGALVGLVGAVITLALLALVAPGLSSFMYQFFMVLPLDFGSRIQRDLSLLVLGTGIGLGVLGSYVSVRSYLIR